MYIWIIDIDGSVADTRPRIDAISAKFGVPENEWTQEQVNEFTKPELIKMDAVITGAENLVSLARTCGAKLVFLTGRSECARRATRIWLENKLDVFDTVPLVMRPEGDFRSTAECKEDVFLKSVYQVYKDAKFIFFEDDEELLLRYSKYGLALKCPECWSVIRYVSDTQVYSEISNMFNEIGNLEKENVSKKSISQKEQELRKPLPPEVLVDALQDKIHKDVGRSRPAKTIKVKNDK